jgi:2-polyprenyl-3-methyl-5-hydroxy-6-metoxy-1,4-benzoquinol methylase
MENNYMLFHSKPLFSKKLHFILSLILITLIPLITSAAEKDQERWDKHYDIEGFLFGNEPIQFLKENIHLLPKNKALDLAMGEGRNGVYLATQGFDVLGLDISPTGLNKANQLAEHHNIKIKTQVVDLESYQLKKNFYDVILCTYYMQRDLFKQIKDSLKPGGMVLIETYNTDYLQYARFPKKYLLEHNELLEIFKEFKIIRYQAYDDGKEAYSSIIAQKLPL